MTQPFNFPQISSPLVNLQTGCLSQEWMMFLISIFNVVGGGNGNQFDVADIENILSTVKQPSSAIDPRLDLVFFELLTKKSAATLIQPDPHLEGDPGINSEVRKLLLRIADIERLFLTQKLPATLPSSVIGAFQSSTVVASSAVSLTTNAAANITSMSLPAGDWDISANTDFTLAGTTATLFQTGISLTSTTLPTQAGGSGLGSDPLSSLPTALTTISSPITLGVTPVRIQLSTATTVYLVAKSVFTAGTVAGYGTLRARRFS